MNLHLNTRKLRHESLEERALLAVTAGGFEQVAALPEPAGATGWIVNTLEDARNWDETDDILSLREAIGRAQTGDTITFDDTLAGGTITLCGSQLNVYRGITIDASTIGGITIDANGQSWVFYVDCGSWENPVELISLTITGGYANSGGGIYNYRSTLTLTGSTVSGNTARYSGGGIYNGSSALTLANSTVSGNTANYGGGIYNDYSALTLINTIVSLNYANEYTDLYSDGSYSSYSANHSIVGSDPGFVTAPVFEGGKLINADELDLSLTPKSIAIDNGANIAVKTETDLAGNPRIYAAWRETPTVDIGAYEYQRTVDPPAPIVVTTLLDAVDETDGLLSLREAIQQADSYAVIAFDESLAGGTVVLEGTELAISTNNLTIDATSIGGITIDAYDQSRVLYIGENTSVWLNGLTVTGGWTEGDGGGIRVANSASLTLTGCTVTKNTATNYGGGIYVAEGGMLTVTGSTVAENTATDCGGGIYSYYGTMAVLDSAVSGNTANAGGGVYNYGTVTITNSAVSGNTANGGGGVYNYGTLTLTDSIVSENTANYGGGICNNYGTLTLTGSIVSENVATGDQGGGIYNDYDSTLTLTNCTVSGNAANESSYGFGGGIFNLGALTLTNTIVALNHAAYDNDIWNYSNPVSGSNNIIGLNPGFVTAPVFENGRLVNADELDLSLTAGSVAIDGGTNTAVETETDFAGNPRIAAAWRETATVDIGAFEYQGTVTRGEIETPSTVVTTVLDVADETDGLISLREAILYAAAGDTVTFDPSLASRTIVLDGADLVIDKNLAIDASALGGITIDGDARSGIFTLRNASGRVTVSLTALAIRCGRAGHGGGIYNDGVILSLTNCTVTKCYVRDGGGIYNTNSGTLTATNTTVADNGYALYTSGGTVTFYNSIITGYFSVSSTRTYAYNTLSSNFTNWTRSQNCPTYNSRLPLFADTSHNDYTLAENSQAINAGNNSYVSAETDLAGNPRILNGTVDLGAYEYTGVIEPLDAPSILTGSRGVYVSYGANRHQVTWTAVDRAVAYEFAYSLDGGSTWTSLETNDTAAVVRGLSYGTDVFYRVRALSSRYLENSDWSAAKSFRVCPMDINNDGDIGGLDRNILGIAWGKEEGDEEYRYYADINGDGDVTGFDRNLLSFNWGCETDDPDLLYPRPLAADAAFAAYASADLDVDLTLF